MGIFDDLNEADLSAVPATPLTDVKLQDIDDLLHRLDTFSERSASLPNRFYQLAQTFTEVQVN